MLSYWKPDSNWPLVFVSESFFSLSLHFRRILFQFRGMLFLTCSKIPYPCVVVVTTAQLHSTKPELRFCTGWHPACGVSKICDGEDLWQWSRLEIRLYAYAFRRSTMPQKSSSSTYGTSPQTLHFIKYRSFSESIFKRPFWMLKISWHASVVNIIVVLLESQTKQEFAEVVLKNNIWIWWKDLQTEIWNSNKNEVCTSLCYCF